MVHRRYTRHRVEGSPELSRDCSPERDETNDRIAVHNVGTEEVLFRYRNSHANDANCATIQV